MKFDLMSRKEFSRICKLIKTENNKHEFPQTSVSTRKVVDKNEPS